MKSLETRMKEYERAYKYVLMSNSYVIIRLDGKNFSKYTSKLDKPFDLDLSTAMNETAKALCAEFNCKFAYTQSDEISIIISDIGNYEAEPIFGNVLQKLCSLTASVATAKFNEIRNIQYLMNLDREVIIDSLKNDFVIDFPKQAYFDSRVFVVPNAGEVLNHMIWRQRDCTRNSVSMAAHELLGHSATMNKSNSEKQDMMMLEKGVNWNDYPTKFKRGVIVYNETYEMDVEVPVKDTAHTEKGTVIRKRWTIDSEIPIFTKERDYLLKFLPI